MDSVDAADLSGAVEARREQLMSPAEQAVSLAVPLAQNGKIQMSRVDLLSRALSSGVPFADVSAEIQRQTESGDLIHLPVVSAPVPMCWFRAWRMRWRKPLSGPLRRGKMLYHR
ncbi:hypothetical protein DAI21_22270 (plasmid) [Lelliottia sp. WB101]|nr:hypothetical protein DAI21_22270 [Lelliottia sp. WB101]